MKKTKKLIEQEKEEKCPLCVLIDSVKHTMDDYGDVCDHFTKAKVEVLEGISQLIHREISSMKKKKTKKGFSKVTVD